MIIPIFSGVDINECEEGSDTCDDVSEDCQNQAGSFSCSCKDGFTVKLNGDGTKTCEGTHMHVEDMTWKRVIMYNWPFVGVTHRSAVDSPHKGPVMLSFDDVVAVSLNKLLKKLANFQ